MSTPKEVIESKFLEKLRQRLLKLSMDEMITKDEHMEVIFMGYKKRTDRMLLKYKPHDCDHKVNRFKK